MTADLPYPRQVDIDLLRNTTQSICILRQDLIELPDDEVLKYLRSDPSLLENLPPSEIVLKRICDEPSISGLFDSLRIDETIPGGWVCPTTSGIVIEFLPSGEKIMADTPFIRWTSKWLGDAQLQSVLGLANWLANRGVPDILDRANRALVQSEEDK